MHEFPCPHCSITLRLRDTSLRGRIIHCPDCGQPLLIDQSGDRMVGLLSTPVKETATHPVPSSRLARWAGLLGGGVVLVVILLVALRQEGPRDQASDTERESPTTDSEIVPAISPEAEEQASEETSETAITAADRLEEIFLVIEAARRLDGRYPSNNREDRKQWSWIAGIADAVLPREPVDWEQSWDAPANNDFVRRRFPLFNNPAIEQQSGQDGFPATHFVGVSGVGVDATEFPSNHPQAGIFGNRRQTTIADVSDGLSNTMLVAGVQTKLGSWARPGSATVRGFSQEPYVNGPDGFGTGQSDGMFVLMADGSVRFFSSETDPIVMRRMAAMADGLPLDPSPPDDPLTLQREPAESVLKEDVADPPIVVPLSPDPPPFKIHERLSQPLIAFEQSEPVTLRKTLLDLQELIGAPIDVTNVPQETLQLEISVQLHDCTVEDVLNAVLASSGLDHHIEPLRIVLFAK